MKDQCDVLPLKAELKERLNQINHNIQQSIDVLDDESYCLLSDLTEIREALQQVEATASSFYIQCYLSNFTTKFKELTVSIMHLSERRHGALIMIQRQDPLETFIHSGVVIEAALTHSLLESIFYPGNPLHDGAVLIQSDRIISAANVLPVSNKLVVDKKLGTRHRAAIGLSERTDALVLIVSEETGDASFAFQGTLHPISVGYPH